MESKYPGLFQFELRRDPKITGRLEVIIYFNSQKADKSAKTVNIHSKEKGQGIPSDNWDAFESRLEENMKKNATQH